VYTNVVDLLRDLADTDERAAMWCACRCARTVLHLVPAGEERPRRAIEAAEEWVRGQRTRRRLRRVGYAAAIAGAAGQGDYAMAHSASCAAARAAAGAAGAVHSASTYADAVQYAVTAALDAARLARLEAPNMRQLLALVSAERWPRTVPAPEQLRAAPEAVQVAWDLVSDITDDIAVPELAEAHDRAERLGLDWGDPVQRAVAERADDEERVERVLASVKHG
jgi:hypothetical protein